MEVLNDSLRNVAKSAELVKSYLEKNNIENDDLLQLALVFLENTVEILSKRIQK